MIASTIRAANLGPILYGPSGSASVLADEIKDALSYLPEGGVLRIDLTGVEVLDLGFARQVYLGLLGGELTARAHTSFCFDRKGRGIIFIGAEPHLANLEAAVDCARDVIVCESATGDCTIVGAAYAGKPAEAFAFVVGSDTPVTSEMLLDARGGSLSNASNLLIKLYMWGLLYRTKSADDMRVYEYEPVIKMRVEELTAS